MGCGKYSTELFFSVTVLGGWCSLGCHGYLQGKAPLLRFRPFHIFFHSFPSQLKYTYNNYILNEKTDCLHVNCVLAKTLEDNKLDTILHVFENIPNNVILTTCMGL